MKRFSATLCLALAGLLQPAEAAPISSQPEPMNGAIESAIEQALQNGAAEDTQWLRLGHWKPRGPVRRIFRSKYRSEADGENGFFLSPDGKNNPAAELTATLRAFATPLQGGDESQHTQCLFPARFKWAVQTLRWDKVLESAGGAVLPCEARKSWKRQLNAEGVSLVFAAAYLGNAASMFGHTFLKFHSKENRGGRDLLDYGVNFAADTGSDGGAAFALRGLFGFYPGYFSMQPYHQTLRTYANLEGRDLVEYRLALTQEELDFFIDHLFELERTNFDYYFLTENCSYFLLAAIETVRPSLELSDVFWYEVIPADSVRVVARTPGLVTSTRFRPALMTLFRAQATKLGTSEARFAKDVIDGGKTEDWSEISTAALDLAIDYGAVRAFRATDDKRYDEINHRLRTERARRGEPSSPAKPIEFKRPEEGHDPARVGFLTEIPTDTAAARARLGLQLRFAYHDRLSFDDGYLRGTTLEVLRTTVFNDDQDPSRIRVREVTVLDILSAQPRDPFSQPLSWKASFGFREPFGSQSLGPFLSGGLGTTLAFSKYLWITGLVSGEALSNPDLENHTPFSVGPQAIATLFLHSQFKVGADYSYFFEIHRDGHDEVLKLEAAWAPLKNLELRVGYSEANLHETRRGDWNAKIYQHLLF